MVLKEESVEPDARLERPVQSLQLTALLLTYILLYFAALKQLIFYKLNNFQCFFNRFLKELL